MDATDLRVYSSALWSELLMTHHWARKKKKGREKKSQIVLVANVDTEGIWGCSRRRRNCNVCSRSFQGLNHTFQGLEAASPALCPRRLPSLMENKIYRDHVLKTRHVLHSRNQ